MYFEKFCQFKNNESTKNFEINIVASYFKKQKNYDNVLAHIVKTMKNVLELSNKIYNKDFVIINIDFLNFDMFSFDTDFAYTITTVMQSLFPEKLKTCYVHNMCSFYKNIVKIILNFLDNNTQSKIKIVK